MHKICLELSGVHATVHPLVNALALHFSLDPVAVVRDAGRADVLALTVLEALLEVPVEVRTVIPLLLAFSVLQVVFPLAFVAFAVVVHVHPIPIRPIVFPLTLVRIARDSSERAVATFLVELPLAFVLVAILADLDALSVAHVTQPLPLIRRPIVQ